MLMLQSISLAIYDHGDYVLEYAVDAFVSYTDKTKIKKHWFCLIKPLQISTPFFGHLRKRRKKI